MREKNCSLEGRWAVVTGGRIKIGYAVCLRLLRAGAYVITITRYPKTALENYRNEADYLQFRDRLFIIGFDLLRVDRISELISDIAEISDGKIDILINNAAQTVKKSFVPFTHDYSKLFNISFISSIWVLKFPTSISFNISYILKALRKQFSAITLSWASLKIMPR